MFDSEDTRLFFYYLNWGNADMPIEDMGLVENAPAEAVLAYEQYKERIKEADENEALI
jgi:hypothetical protein